MKFGVRSIAVASATLLTLGLAGCSVPGDEGLTPEESQETDALQTQAEEQTAEAEATDDEKLAVGDVLEHGDWKLTLNDATLNANDEVTAANELDAAPEGEQFALFNVTIVYEGQDTPTVNSGTAFEFVTADGETFSPHDDEVEVEGDSTALESGTEAVAAPDGLNTGEQLSTNATVTGNVLIIIPADSEGDLRVTLDGQEALFAVS